jgi:DNA-directed RNA polymerase subunit RPC12/RpoP
MWTKYDYVCSDCDALIEITTLDNIREWRGWCPCGSANIINISVRDATVPDDVTTITYVDVVKINTNPYTL